MNNIRPCVPDDLGWLAALAETAFGPLVEGYDQRGAEAWINACLRSPKVITMRGDHVAAFAGVFTNPWAPTVWICDVLHVFGGTGAPMEAVAVVRAIVEQSRSMGCRQTYIGSAYRDISAIGKRLGGRPLNPVYVVESDVQ